MTRPRDGDSPIAISLHDIYLDFSFGSRQNRDWIGIEMSLFSLLGPPTLIPSLREKIKIGNSERVPDCSC